MSETSAPRRVLHLVIEGFTADQPTEISAPSPGTTDFTEVFPLTEANAQDALKKIFEADTVAVWGPI